MKIKLSPKKREYDLREPTLKSTNKGIDLLTLTGKFLLWLLLLLLALAPSSLEVLVEIPIVDHLIMQYTKAKYLIYFYNQFSESLIEHEQHQ